jgi:hypothetical protein
MLLVGLLSINDINNCGDGEYDEWYNNFWLVESIVSTLMIIIK